MASSDSMVSSRVPEQLPGQSGSAAHSREAEVSCQVYTFGGGANHDDPRARDKTVTGGKGANLSEMASIGLPVPPGFTITTDGCVRNLQHGADPSTSLKTGSPAILEDKSPRH